MKIVENKLFVSQITNTLTSYVKLFKNQKVKVAWSVINKNQKLILGAHTNNFILWENITLNFVDEKSKNLLSLKKEASFFYHDFELFEESVLLGRIKTQSKIIQFYREYYIFDKDDHLILICRNKFGTSWDFKIFNPENEQKKFDNIEAQAFIQRRSRNLFSEAMTGKKHYEINFGNIQDDTKKVLVLMTAFVLDLCVFKK